MNEALSFSSIFISFFALLVAITSLVLVLAMKFSTHKIEFKPLVTQELKEEEKFKEEEEDEKLLESVLNLQRKKKKKQEDPLDTILETANF